MSTAQANREIVAIITQITSTIVATQDKNKDINTDSRRRRVIADEEIAGLKTSFRFTAPLLQFSQQLYVQVVAGFSIKVTLHIISSYPKGKQYENDAASSGLIVVTRLCE